MVLIDCFGKKERIIIVNSKRVIKLITKNYLIDNYFLIRDAIIANNGINKYSQALYSTGQKKMLTLQLAFFYYCRDYRYSIFILKNILSYHQQHGKQELSI